MAKWPDFQYTAEAPDGTLMGYIMGKAEGEGENWHGHVTAVTVAPDYRRLGLASQLMSLLEEISEKMWAKAVDDDWLLSRYDGYFVDLFVRYSNRVAIGMYQSFGYSTYRQVIGYYSGEEDALGKTRTRLPCDTDGHMCRYAESTPERRTQEVNYSTTTSGVSKWIRLANRWWLYSLYFYITTFFGTLGWLPDLLSESYLYLPPTCRWGGDKLGHAC